MIAYVRTMLQGEASAQQIGYQIQHSSWRIDIDIDIDIASLIALAKFSRKNDSPFNLSKCSRQEEMRSEKMTSLERVDCEWRILPAAIAAIELRI